MRPISRAALASAALAAVSLGSSNSIAMPVPASYTAQLQARANLAANPGGSFNVPHGSTFGSTTVSMNNLGEVASKMTSVGTASPTQHGIFYGPGDGTGGVVAQRSTDEIFWSDVNIGDSGRIVVPQSSSSQDGFYFRDRGQPAGVTFLTSASGLSSSGHRVLPDNRVLARTSLGGVVGHRSYNPAGGAVQTYVTQAVGGFSFLGTAAPSDNGQIASRVFNDAQPSTSNDEIRRFNPDGSSTLIFAEGQTVPGMAGTIGSFFNSVGMNASGMVTAVANVGGKSTVLIGDGTTTRVVANVDSPLVAVIDSFVPAVNSAGLVAFRGRDDAGLDAIFLGDGFGALIRVIGENDVVSTDLGAGQLGQHDTSNIFSGGIALNDSNQIAFTAGLHPNGNNQIEWGTGIFVANAVPEPGSFGVIAVASAALMAQRRRRD